jgi:hypothetical protein
MVIGGASESAAQAANTISLTVCPQAVTTEASVDAATSRAGTTTVTVSAGLAPASARNADTCTIMSVSLSQPDSELVTVTSSIPAWKATTALERA